MSGSFADLFPSTQLAQEFHPVENSATPFRSSRRNHPTDPLRTTSRTIGGFNSPHKFHERLIPFSVDAAPQLVVEVQSGQHDHDQE